MGHWHSFMTPRLMTPDQSICGPKITGSYKIRTLFNDPECLGFNSSAYTLTGIVGFRQRSDFCLNVL